MLQTHAVVVDEINDSGANIEFRRVSPHVFQVALRGVDEGVLVHAQGLTNLLDNLLLGQLVQVEVATGR